MQFNNLGKQWEIIREKSLEKIDQVGFQGSYINGPDVSKFEEEYSNHYGSRYSVGVSNGTDGLKLALQTYDLSNDDLVIMPANTFVADYLAVKHLPLVKPKVALIDHNDYFTIDVDHLESFLKNEREKYNKVVVIPVHLYGQPCDMDRIVDLGLLYNFHILEDCSQSHESTYKNKMLGSFGEMSVYSLYPGKNLGAIGDAGIITTNDENIYQRLKSIRNYGSKVKYHYDELGHNNRLDTIQSIVLLEKLKYISSWTDRKIKISNRFLSLINNPKVSLPQIPEYTTKHSFHIFCVMVEDRKSFELHLSEAGIPTIIHYPIPFYKTKVWDSENDIIFSSSNTDSSCDKIISIPLHPFLEEDEINIIISTINKY
jgi:dTDP-4-amino-4,6-dideoxygalactose transaminase